MKHLVSIVVPVYNSEKYLEETIESILNQSYSDFEIILIDDGSTDLSGTICDEFALKDNRIKVEHIPNSGPSFARNIGIQISKGEYILPVDSDDIIESTYVEKAAKVLEKNDNIGIVYCKARLIGDYSGEWMIPSYSLPEILVKNCIFATAMFRKCDWKVVGGYSEIMRYGLEDYDLWLSIISLKRKVYQIPEILFQYRKHNNSRSNTFEKDKLIVENTERLRFLRHRNLYENVYYIPTPGIKNALYGAGGAGKTYFEFLKSIGNNSITCCFDKNFKSISNQIMPIAVRSPRGLIEDKYDQVVIAINKDDIYIDIRNWLIDNGYQKNQIKRYVYMEKIKEYM